MEASKGPRKGIEAGTLRKILLGTQKKPLDNKTVFKWCVLFTLLCAINQHKITSDICLKISLGSAEKIFIVVLNCCT